MTRTELKKRYAAAALVSAAIITGIVLYAAVVEALRRFGHTPPLVPPAAYAAKYAFYFLGVPAVAALKFIARLADAKKPTPEGTLKQLTGLAVARAAVCEVPAVCGLMLYILTGYYADFYLLAVFSLALELYHFPRPGAWEERLRLDFGQLAE